MMEKRQIEGVRGKTVPWGEKNKFKDIDMENRVAFWVTHTKRCQNSFDFMNNAWIKGGGLQRQAATHSMPAVDHFRRLDFILTPP